MKAATLVHVETGIEYYRDGELIMPSRNEKIFWAMNGTPQDIERKEQTFETEIDEFIGFNELEIKFALNKNIENGVYNYLPSNGTLELRIRKSANINNK